MKAMFRTLSVTALAALCAFASGAVSDPEPLDWSKARDIAPGVKYLSTTFREPRIMASYIIRVDLAQKGLRVTGSGRADNWGKPMPDHKKHMPIDTRLEKTLDFFERHRRGGTNIVVAVNSAAWRPWEKPYKNSYGSFHKFLVSSGQVVSHALERGPMLVVLRSKLGRNVAGITDRLDDRFVPFVSVAHPAWFGGKIMDNGEPTMSPSPSGAPELAPRTALGLSKDRRWLYILVVDGRQPGYSLGADMFDLVRMMKAAGASDAVNMDGGGSSTLVYWDGRRPVVANRHDKHRRKYRRVAASIGIYLED